MIHIVQKIFTGKGIGFFIEIKHLNLNRQDRQGNFWIWCPKICTLDVGSSMHFRGNLSNCRVHLQSLASKQFLALTQERIEDFLHNASVSVLNFDRKLLFMFAGNSVSNDLYIKNKPIVTNLHLKCQGFPNLLFLDFF